MTEYNKADDLKLVTHCDYEDTMVYLFRALCDINISQGHLAYKLSTNTEK